jgi:hypothetical protein
MKSAKDEGIHFFFGFFWGACGEHVGCLCYPGENEI